MALKDVMPDRPLTGSDVEALEDHSSIEAVRSFMETGGPDGRRIFSVVLSLEDEHIALWFDDEDGSQWRVADRSADFAEAAGALSPGDAVHAAAEDVE